ncbi:DUF397 domain-containing protein [Micromonospora sp. NPDC023966]|uniref:DUF397 domain-containing protein n=1 Tax=Micromonospora sp. NPDC023966 TaxID=3154699 RepID=UPI0033EE062B
MTPGRTVRTRPPRCRRDPKDSTGPVLTFDPPVWRAFVAGSAATSWTWLLDEWCV